MPKRKAINSRRLPIKLSIGALTRVRGIARVMFHADFVRAASMSRKLPPWDIAIAICLRNKVLKSNKKSGIIVGFFLIRTLTRNGSLFSWTGILFGYADPP